MNLILLYIIVIIQGGPKKMSFLGKMAITNFKIIQNAKVGGVFGKFKIFAIPDGH